MKKIIVSVLLGIVILVAALATYVMAAWNKTYDAPLPDLKASTDSAVIARGKYLAYGPAHCALCHVPMDKIADVQKGMDVPLSGGWELPIPPGTFRSANLTSDPETGIGKVSDGQLARAMRHAVKRDGKVLFPFMPFQQMSDEDVIAVISFLRTQPAIKNKVPTTEYSFLGKVILAFGLLKPEGPKETPPKTVFRDVTATYGGYLANSVANCNGCHTNRDMATGAFIGEPFAGGLYMEPDAFSQGYGFVTPNLTPDPETGRIAEWTEEVFVARMKAGRRLAGSHMPWEQFARMDTVDLKALYAYLRTVKPVHNAIDKIVYNPGEKPQK